MQTHPPGRALRDGADSGGVALALGWLLFLPKSLAIELLFDLGHCAARGLCHWSPFLYAHVHGVHHRHQYPGPLSTFEKLLLDLLLSNAAPMMAALALGPVVSLLQLHLLMAYKTYVKVAGHSDL